MALKNIGINNDRIIKNLSWFFEYVLVVTIILECASLLTVVVSEESSIKMIYVFTPTVLGSLFALFCLKLTNKESRKLYKEKFLPIAIGLEVYAILYFFPGLANADKMGVYLNYVAKFMIFLPLMASILFLERKESGKFELLFKYSNVVCIIAFINLIVFYTAVLHMNEVQSELVYLKWYKLGELSTLVNFLNLCTVNPGTRWQSFNLYLLRDFGPFTEPLLFLIPLGTTLFIELFLRPAKDSWRLWRWLLISVTIFTVQSTYGLMLLVIAFGLKFMSMCSKKEKIIFLVPVAVFVAAGCAYFVRYKARGSQDIIEYLMNNKHITDFVYPLQAFMKKPLFAGGFMSDELTYSFFSEKALADKGFSNSIAVILGQGGLALGLLCNIPFVLCFLQGLKKGFGNRKFALWAIGPFYLYVLVVFHYTYFMILLFAIGYALLEIKNSESKDKKISISVFPEEPIGSEGDTEGELLKNVKSILKKSRWKEPLGMMLIAVCLVIYGAPLWNQVYRTIDLYQLSFGQSAVRTLFAVITFIVGVASIRWAMTGKSGTGEKLIAVGYVAVINSLYIKVYPVIYSYADTITGIWLRNKDFIREALLLLFYFGLVILALYTFDSWWKFIHEKKMAILLKPVALIMLIASLITSGGFVIRHKLEEKLPDISSETEMLSEISKITKGNIYTDSLSVLFKQAVPDIKYTVAKGNGFRTQKNATILEPMGRELTALFNAGYQVAKLSDNYLVYSDDEDVTGKLSQEGYKFYRFYAFPRECDLQYLAELNDLKLTKDGDLETVVLEGKNHSLVKGIGDTLEPGRYTVDFSLKIDQEDYKDAPEDELICKVIISHGEGKKPDQTLVVTKSEFDEVGQASIQAIISAGARTEGYQYLVEAEDDDTIGVQGISVTQTPTQITVTGTNVYQRSTYEAHYDVEGNASYTKQGYSGIERRYDYYNNVAMTKYLDENDDPVLTTDGYAEIRYDYDEKQRIIEEAYFDEKGEPVASTSGIFRVQYGYDEAGNKNDYRYCDADGNLMNQANGVARTHYIFNDEGRWIRAEYYDTEGNPVLQKEGYAIVERDYDETGNVTEQRFCGLQNEPILYNERYHKYRDEFNEKKQCIKELYYGTDGEPILQSGGYYGYERSYDDAGNVIRNMYLGADEKPVITDWGYACWHRSYNSKKQIIREEYYDTDEKRILLGSGISAVEYERDSKGNAVSEKYFGIEDEAVLNTSNIAEVKREFNDLNQKISEEYFDLDGKRTLNTSGISRCEYEYDENGKLIKKTFRDMDGNVVEEQIVE